MIVLVLTLVVGAQEVSGAPDGAAGAPDTRLVEPFAADKSSPAMGSQAGAAGAGDVVPVVDSVEFTNRTYFREETLRTFLLHPIPGELDEGLLRADAQRIADRFRDRGFLQAQVKLEVVPSTPPRGVRAIFEIEAGKRAELKRVKVVGNVDVPERALKEGFFSRPPEPLGVLSQAGLFHKPYFDQDQQRLVANYYKRGYLEARVLDTRVEAEPDLDGLAVTMRVIEGPVYELAGIVFTGEKPEGAIDEEMRTKITVKDGDVADLVTIQQQADALLEPLRREGHPFARFEQAVAVAPPPSGDPARRAIVLTLKFVRGPKPVVREVRIAGNRGTAERVIRRDVFVEPNTPYDHDALKRTERALMATGFFQAVQARALPTDDAGVVDIEVTVTEAQTWLVSIAPGYDESSGGLIGVGILADRNFLGTGLYVSTFARLSALKQTFDFTVSEPRLLDTRATLTGELHRRELNFLDFRLRSEVGGGVRTSVPLGAGFFVGGGVGVEYGGVVPYTDDERLEPKLIVVDAPGELGLFPSNTFRNVLSLSFIWDNRDSLLLPRNGAYASVSTSYAGPFTLSGAAFLDGDASLKLFWTPLWGITLKSNMSAGAVTNPHGGRVPVTDRYFLGGLGSVRGYLGATIAPTEEVPLEGGDAARVQVGGVVRFVQNLEAEFPLWPDTPFRGFLFLDAGNAFSQAELDAGGRLIDRGLRVQPPLGLFYSTGFGFLLETPVLPFRFEWSVPLTPRPDFAFTDRPISFFLGIGSAF